MTSETIAIQNEWLRLGAREKARSVQLRTQGLELGTLLEVGAGTGAILKELDELAASLLPKCTRSNPRQPLLRLPRVGGPHLPACRFGPGGTRRLTPGPEAVRPRRPLPCPRARRKIQRLSWPRPSRSATTSSVEVPLEGNRLGNLRAAVEEEAYGSAA